MGTLLDERGIGYPYDRANLLAPEAVGAVHEQYLRAGASVLETNTFSANAAKLARQGLEGRVREINEAGARIARSAADAHPGDALVLGAIGPLGRALAPVGPIAPDWAHSAYREQAEALLDGGADALVLETFVDLEELRVAYRAVSGLGAPVLLLKTFVEDGETLADGLPGRVARELAGWGGSDGSSGLPLVGANCTVGPQRMLGIIEGMASEVGPVAAFPTPGLPQLVEGRVRYNRDAGHFARYGLELANAGARLVGGCCGTTPEHVRALAEALRDFRPEGGAKRAPTAASLVEERSEARSAEPGSAFAKKLLGGGFAVAVEVDLPRGYDVSSVVEAARRLGGRGVDAIDISDGARARLRMHPVAAAKIVRDETGMDVVAHVSCRDRNIIGLQADLLSAAALGVKNILAVTGDPAQIGDYPEATSVFDTDAVGLVHVLAKMNGGEDLAGNKIGEPPGFLIGAAFNPTAEDLDGEIDKLRRKVEAGAHAFWTQPVFEMGALEEALEAAEDVLDGRPILLGLMPLRSARQAEFLHHEVPGVSIPKGVRRKLAELDGEDAPKFGVEVAQNLLAKAQPFVGGAYLMPPASRPDLAGDVLEALGSQASGGRHQVEQPG